MIHVVGPPYRALDGRITNIGDRYQELAEEVADRINRYFIYDGSRPEKRVALAYPHGNGPHIHHQVHPSTKRSD